MIAALLLTTFLIAVVVASIVVLAFDRSIRSILARVVPSDISPAWANYLRFALYVVGIGGGVRVWDLEKYLTRVEPYTAVLPLTSDRWMVEIYQTIIGTLQSTAAVLLAFFVMALIAVVIVRLFESRPARPEAQPAPGNGHAPREAARREGLP